LSKNPNYFEYNTLGSRNISLDKAFTLIELLVVVAIIGILAAVGVVAYNGYTASAKRAAAQANFKMAEKKLTEAFTMCKSGLDFFWSDGRNCQNGPINGDTLAWGVYGDFSKSIKVNPYDSNTKAIEWSQLSDGFANCPPKKPAKGQIKFSYANSKNNFCNMGGGNTSCVYANIGKKDGSDDYLYAEFNFCEF